MNYIIEYEISVIIFVIAIIVVFYKSHFFPSTQNKLFGSILIFTTADMILDVVTAITIEHALTIPFWINYLLNSMFYTMQIIFPVIGLFYAIAITGRLWTMCRKKILLSIVPGMIVILLLIINPFTHIFFYLDKVEGYVKTPYFYFMHVVAAMYLFIVVAYLIKNRKVLNKKQATTAIWFLLIIILAMCIQIIIPRLLILGPAIGISVIVMYFMLKNPSNMIDYVTKAFNYNGFVTCLIEIITEKKSLNMIAIEIHDLLYIKRIFGIKSTNNLLWEISSFLRGDLKQSWVFRITDSRFIIITQKRSKHEDLKMKISQRFTKPWSINSTKVMPSVVVCCVGDLNGSHYGMDNLVNMIESALVNAVVKSENKPFYIVENCNIEDFSHTLSIESALHDVFEKGTGLVVYYQPIYSLLRKRFIGLEALVRFEHPTLGLLLPSEFLSIVERNGHIQKLDQIVVSKVCDFVNHYNPFEELDLDFICINLSAAEFASCSMSDDLTDILVKNMKHPEKIFFEVTETIAASSKENLKQCMNQYISLGYRFALDDFGTGYSNISQIVAQPFSLIKIDQSLLQTSHKVIDYIISMIESLDKMTLIEGVETKEHFDMVKNMKADLLQGFYFAKPMSEDMLLPFIHEYKIDKV